MALIQLVALHLPPDKTTSPENPKLPVWSTVFDQLLDHFAPHPSSYHVPLEIRLKYCLYYIIKFSVKMGTLQTISCPSYLRPHLRYGHVESLDDFLYGHKSGRPYHSNWIHSSLPCRKHISPSSSDAVPLIFLSFPSAIYQEYPMKIMPVVILYACWISDVTGVLIHVYVN